MVRARGFTSAIVATIALTTAGACTVVALVNAILLRPLPYANADRLVGLWHTLPGAGIPVAKQSLGTYALYRESAKSLEQVGVFVSLSATIAYPGSGSVPERARIGYMTPSMFAVLGAKPMMGRVFTDGDAHAGATPVVIISERSWRTRLGGVKDILGRTVDIDGARRTIVGVMPESFAFPEERTPVWGPLDASNPAYLGSFGFDGVGLLRPGVSASNAQRELARILLRAAERFPEQRPGVSTALVLRDTKIMPVVHAMRDDVIAGFDRVLWLIAGAVGLLVIVALSTVASLLLVRVEARRPELAVRAALGASMGSLLGSVVAESALVAAMGTVVGVVVAAFAIQLFVQLAPAGLARLNEVRVDSPALLTAAALALTFVMLSVVIGMARLPTHNAMRALRAGPRAGHGGVATQRFRAAFVVVEVAMSLVLLAGAGVLGRSIIRLREVKPGFDPSNVFTFWTFLPPSTYKGANAAARFYRDALARFEQLPGVIAVAATAKLPLEIEGFPYRVTVWGDDGSANSDRLPPVVQATSTTSGYFGAMRIPLIAGRTYDDANVRRGALEAVASRGYVESVWHDPTGRSGVGRRLRPSANGPWFTIVGVVNDVRDSTLALPAVSEVYFPEEPNGDTTGLASTTGRDMAFVVRTRDAVSTIEPTLRREMHALDPNLPFHRPATMDDIASESRSRLTFAIMVLGVGAAAAVLLGVLGLYGALAYVVSLRSREISIRIALGLEPSGAARMVARHGSSIICVGVAAGVALFVAFAKLLTSLTYDVRAFDPAAIGVAAAAVATIAVGAMWIPARRAASINPADALKSE